MHFTQLLAGMCSFLAANTLPETPPTHLQQARVCWVEKQRKRTMSAWWVVSWCIVLKPKIFV